MASLPTRVPSPRQISVPSPTMICSADPSSGVTTMMSAPGEYSRTSPKTLAALGDASVTSVTGMTVLVPSGAGSVAGWGRMRSRATLTHMMMPVPTVRRATVSRATRALRHVLTNSPPKVP